MMDFLINNRGNIMLFVEVLAAVTGLVLYKKYKHTAAKYFIFFLVYTVIIVVVGKYTYYVKNDGILSFLDGTVFERNYWWYTLFWKIGASVFFGFYYSKILVNKVLKKILKFSVVLFIFISIALILFNLPLYFTGAIPLVSILSALIILQCVFFYFLEILQSDKILSFYTSLNFYISVAILLFWLIKTPLAFFEPYYTKTDRDYVYLRSCINLVVISFMYISYIVGLIVSKPEYD